MILIFIVLKTKYSYRISFQVDFSDMLTFTDIITYVENHSGVDVWGINGFPPLMAFKTHYAQASGILSLKREKIFHRNAYFFSVKLTRGIYFFEKFEDV